MRSVSQRRAAFACGFLTGLSAACVAIVTAAAARRACRQRAEPPGPFIDLEPYDGIELQLRPAEEANTTATPPRLESELPEFSPRSQRW